MNRGISERHPVFRLELESRAAASGNAESLDVGGDTKKCQALSLALKLVGAEHSYEPEEVGNAMYRLGEFGPWYGALPKDSPLKKHHHLHLKITAFQSDPTEKNRKFLKQWVQAREKCIPNRQKTGDIGKNWWDHVRHFGWLHEAKRVLADNQPGNAKSPQK